MEAKSCTTLHSPNHNGGGAKPNLELFLNNIGMLDKKIDYIMKL